MNSEWRSYAGAMQNIRWISIVSPKGQFIERLTKAAFGAVAAKWRFVPHLSLSTSVARASAFAYLVVPHRVYSGPDTCHSSFAHINTFRKFYDGAIPSN